MKTRTFIQTIAIILVLLAALYAGKKIVAIAPPATGSGEHEHEHGEHHDHEEEEVAKGPKGGKLVGTDDLQAEFTMYEGGGIEPHFRVYFYENHKAIDPAGIELHVELHRLNRTDAIDFAKQGDFLAAQQPAVEPHSFDLKATAKRGGKTFEFAYESVESRVEIGEEVQRKSGIVVEAAGPARLVKTVPLHGRIVANEEQMTHVIPRFPGVIKAVNKRLGDKVEKGDVLATVESNESLRAYNITAELAGTVIAKDATLGEFVSGQERIFTIADLTTVWADFNVYRQDFPLLKEGQTVVLDGGPGLEKAEAKVSYISPFGAENSQTMLARVLVPNEHGQWRPGLFVGGEVIAEESDVPVAVKATALQSMNGEDVVFINVGDLFEMAPVQVGRRDAEWVEITEGLKAGDRYAAANSFIVKADIGKAGAAHEH